MLQSVKLVKDLKRLAWSGLAAGIIVTASSCAPRVCKLPQAVIDSSAQIRGLPFKSNPSCQEQNVAVMRRSLYRIFEKKSDPARIKFEGRTFRALGIIPEKFRYPEEVLEFYSRHLLAFYDSISRQIIMPKGRNQGSEDQVLSHELIHTLQDQHYGVERLANYSMRNDVASARLALLEGDANWVGHNYAGITHCAERSEAKILEDLVGAAAVDPTFPPILQMYADFPYIYGERLVCELRSRGGRNLLERAFKYPPISTAEVMNLDSYIDRLRRGVALEPGDEPKDGYRDTLGSFIFLAMFSRVVPSDQARELARNWRSDELREIDSKITWSIKLNDSASRAGFELSLRDYLERFAAGTFELLGEGDSIEVTIEKRSQS